MIYTRRANKKRDKWECVKNYTNVVKIYGLMVSKIFPMKLVLLNYGKQFGT